MYCPSALSTSAVCVAAPACGRSEHFHRSPGRFMRHAPTRQCQTPLSFPVLAPVRLCLGPIKVEEGRAQGHFLEAMCENTPVTLSLIQGGAQSLCIPRRSCCAGGTRSSASDCALITAKKRRWDHHEFKCLRITGNNQIQMQWVLPRWLVDVHSNAACSHYAVVRKDHLARVACARRRKRPGMRIAATVYIPMACRLVQ